MWSNGATTEDITAVVGTYFITVTDVNGCTQSGAYTINAPIPLQVNAGNDQTICPGQTTNLSASGTISYSWISGGTFTPSANVASPTVQPFITTNYIVAGTDHNNCISYDTVTVFVKAMILSASTTNISTCGGNDGAINLTVVGGNFPYTYSWSNGATQEDLIGNLTAGSYQCIVTDIIGCKDTIAVTLSDPASFSINATANNPSSCGGNDGSISLNIIGNPLNPVTAVNGIQGAPLTSLPAGFYNITVTDANNCTAAVGVTLSSPIPTQIYAGADTFYCSGSSLQLNASTNGIVSYSWTSSGTLSCTLCPNPIVNPSTTTVYTVFGTDNNGCVSSDQVSVTPSTLTLTVSSTNTTQCGTNTGTLTALVSGSTGAVTYTWSAGPNPNASFQTGVAPGIYTVQVHDLISGCLASGTATIQDPVNFQVSVSLTQPSTCGGTDGSLTANVTTGGSYLFSWNGVAGNATLANVSAGIYQLTVKDALGCAFVKSDTLTDPIPTKPNAGTDQFLCAGTSYTITVTGGTFTSAQWTPSTGLSSATILNPVATPTSSVTYTLITVDNKNCTSYDTISFTVSNLQTSTAVTNNVNCGANNASIDLTVTGGIPPLTHLWNTGATTEDISNLTAGIYIDTIIDAIGCIDTVVVVISDPVTFTETLTVTPITQCGATGSVNVTITGATPPVTITLNGNNVTMPQTNLSPGNYALLIQDGLGCTKSDFFTLTNPDTNYVIANSDITACYGTNGLQLGATAPVSGSYQWSPATGLSQTNIPNPTITFIDTTIAYVVTFTDAANCVYRDTQVVYSIKIDTISTNTLPATDCFASNGSITINAAGGISPITYNWNTGLSGASISGLSAGTYSVTITESSTLNCSRTFTFSVQSQLPLITLAGNDTTLCSGDSIKLEATGAITYTWSLLNGTLIGLNNPINVLPITGNTTYIVTGALGYCTDSDTVTITLLSSPTAEAGPDVQILEGNPELIGGSPTGPTNVTYSWYPIDGLSDPTSANPKANPKQTTVYYVVVQDNFGCKGIDSVKVIVYLGIIVPSGFTPNGDGSNDKWIIDFIYKYPKAIVQVYNRWGQKLYESAPGYPEPWDGKYNGQDLPVGTYYYVIDLKDDTIKPYTGPITIMR
jgi:gliding motility-associated-like protein